MGSSGELGELRGLTLEDLAKKVSSLREELLKLHIKASSTPLDKPSEIKRVRRSIARAVTVLKERRAAA